MSLFISKQKGPRGTRVQNHATVTRRDKYSQEGSEGKLCSVKLAFLFHMNDLLKTMAVIRARKSIAFKS